MPTPAPDDATARLVRRYLNDPRSSMSGLAREYGCSAARIRRRLLEAGVPLRLAGGRASRQRTVLPPDVLGDLVYAYRSQHVSLTELARRHGCSQATVKDRLLEAGVRIRPRGGLTNEELAARPRLERSPDGTGPSLRYVSPRFIGADRDRVRAQVVARYRQGATVRAIADEFERSTGWVYHLLYEAGVKTVRAGRPTPAGTDTSEDQQCADPGDLGGHQQP